MQQIKVKYVPTDTEETILSARDIKISNEGSFIVIRSEVEVEVSEEDEDLGLVSKEVKYYYNTKYIFKNKIVCVEVYYLNKSSNWVLNIDLNQDGFSIAFNSKEEAEKVAEEIISWFKPQDQDDFTWGIANTKI